MNGCNTGQQRTVYLLKPYVIFRTYTANASQSTANVFLNVIQHVIQLEQHL